MVRAGGELVSGKAGDMDMPRTIKTERLVLRAIKAQDAISLFEGAFRDEEVMRYLEWRPHRAARQTQALVNRWVRSWERGQRFMYSIFLKSGTKAIGCTSLEPDKSGRQMEIGGLLTRSLGGRGYMPEAWKALIKRAFRQPGVCCVWAVCDVRNSGSRKALKKSGMVYEHTLRRYIVRPNISPEPRDVRRYAVVRGLPK
jgi:RimJ/RimL family protein N-acetyltransferase